MSGPCNSRGLDGLLVSLRYRNRKRKSSLSSLTNGVEGSDSGTRAKIDHVAIGTADGSIVIYSLVLGQVKHNEAKVHASRVNDLVSPSFCKIQGYVG